MPTYRHVEYMAFPRIFAMAEHGWLPQKKKNYDDFLKRVNVAVKRLDVMDINYRALDK